ncbi:IPTL-CTERM sorting domain-containing protein [Brevundimonas sp.]|uniref:IPTL-CTERM sorting domain-containing protein n=1 Tax=Brevundimonas sp. TaxID=1871086 RepID=UPI003D0C51B6
MFGGSTASAQTIGDSAYNATFPLQTGIQSVIGQSVSPPSGRLDSYTLYLRRNTATLSVIPFVYEWTGDPQPYPTTVVWTGAPVSVTATAITPVTFTTGGVVLDPAKIYVLAVRLANPAETGTYGQNEAGTYAPGSRVFGNTTTLNGGGVSVRDLPFSATFTPTVPAPVPTLSEWAMILLGLTLAGAAVLIVQQRRLSA